MNNFIDYLQIFVKKFEGKRGLLRAIILYESYHTLQNSISQVGSIVSELISKYAFDIINKKGFYEKVANEYFELIEDVKKKENSQYLVDLTKMKHELENLNSYEDERNIKFEYASTFYSDSCSEVDENSGEAMHNLSIEELFKLLTQETQKKRRRNRRKNKNNSLACESLPDKEMEKIDEEVEEFAKRIEGISLDCDRAKPNVSQEFLSGLKEKIKNISY